MGTKLSPEEELITLLEVIRNQSNEIHTYVVSSAASQLTEWARIHIRRLVGVWMHGQVVLERRLHSQQMIGGALKQARDLIKLIEYTKRTYSIPVGPALPA